jgi:hypothetical protein
MPAPQPLARPGSSSELEALQHLRSMVKEMYHSRELSNNIPVGIGRSGWQSPSIVVLFVLGLDPKVVFVSWLKHQRQEYDQKTWDHLLPYTATEWWFSL